MVHSVVCNDHPILDGHCKRTLKYSTQRKPSMSFHISAWHGEERGKNDPSGAGHLETQNVNSLNCAAGAAQWINPHHCFLCFTCRNKNLCNNPRDCGAIPWPNSSLRRGSGVKLWWICNLSPVMFYLRFDRSLCRVPHEKPFIYGI